MRALAFAIALANAGIGARAALQAAGVLRDGKYATGTTAAFAVLFLGLGAFSLFAAWSGWPPRTVTWIGLAPWALGAFVLFLQLLVGNPQ